MNHQPLDQIESEILAFTGESGFFALDLEDGCSFGYGEDRVLEIASTFKILPLIASYRLADDDALDLEQKITVTRKNHTRGSGLLRELPDETTTTLRNMLRLMIIVSDNVATVEVLKVIGVESVNETAKSLGLEDTRFYPPSAQSRGYCTSTARQLVLLMKSIIEGSAASGSACAEMREVLSRQFYLDQLPRFLSINRYAIDLDADPVLTVRNKTGFSKGIRSDVGSFEVPDRAALLMAAITNWDQTDEARQNLLFEPATVLHGTLGRIAIDSVRPGLTEIPTTHG